MNTYPLNQEPIPQIQIGSEQHHRFVNVSIVAVAVALIIGMLYWWSVSGSPKTVTQSKADLRAQIADQLRREQVQVTQQEITTVASKLSTANVTVTDAQKQAVAHSLSEQ